ncbi:MAG: DMT family transporter [Rhodobacteraceae bacterium]|nr:MAG: DMT family transporter [Paracoccaceae bacterium]
MRSSSRDGPPRRVATIAAGRVGARGRLPDRRGCVKTGEPLGRRSPLTPLIWIAALCVVAAGMALSTQAPVNAALARLLGGPLPAASVSFGVGLVILIAATGLQALAAGPRAAPDFAGAPWWVWIGGVLGAVYVVTITATVGTLGVLTLVAATVLGQLIGALVLDAVGAFGLPQRPITWTRALAPVLVAGGLVLSRA